MLTRLDLRGHRGSLAGRLPEPPPPGGSVAEAVRQVIEEVRLGGDAALAKLTARFDHVAVDQLAVPLEELEAARRRLAGPVREALEVAFERISAYHAFEAGSAEAPVFDDGEVTVRDLVRPVRRAGVYAPGGRARYPSSVLMCVAPARVAGVSEVVLCAPPGPDGRVDDATLAAAAVAGVDEVFCVGGAQAIAAMALGTASISRVDVVVGPGNAYVAEAKRQLSGLVGVASAFAGPSEVVVVAGPTTPPRFAAVDLAVQAEHGPDGLAWLLTWDEGLLEAVDGELEAIVAGSPRRQDLEATLATGGYACLVDDPPAAVEVANAVAPEHLELLFEGSESLLPLVEAAGAVFCGPFAPASVGDYVAGPNHVLPTNRTARFASALRAEDFVRHVHAVSVSEEALRDLGPTVEALAEVEGLAAHAESVRVRR